MIELEEEGVRYRTLLELSRRAKERARSAPFDSYVADIGLPALGKKSEDRRITIEEYFDTVDRSIFEQSLIRLVAIFERKIFEKLSTAIGQARSSIDDHYPKSTPFSHVAKQLIKNTTENITNLSDVEKLLRTHPKVPSEDLQALREHRNWLCHGGRVGRQSNFTSIEDISALLSHVLDLISQSETD